MSHSQNRSRRLLPVAIALALGLPAAQAATITVTSAGDAGTASTCTLRQALDSANSDSTGTSFCVAGSGDDIIVFSSALANSTISLSNPLVISSNVTITGSGQILDGDNESRVLDVSIAYNVALSNLTVTHGNADYGAGIAVHLNGQPERQSDTRGSRGHRPSNAAALDTVLSLNNVSVVNNRATQGGGAGLDINQYANVTINQSTISGNTATATDEYVAAGGISASRASSITISNSVISGNTVTGSTSYIAGGLYAYYSQVVLNNVTFSGNSATGGDFVAGALAIASSSGSTKYTQLNDCTLSANSASGTGAYIVGGALVGYSGSAGALHAANTIITGNSGTTANVLLAGAATFTAASSLLGVELQESNAGNGNKFAASAGLGPLSNNGGMTQTMALLAGSPAIDAGNNALVPPVLTTDQRGAGFPRIANGTVDIGAFELQGAAAAPGIVPLPTLSAWAAALFSTLLAVIGIAGTRRRFDG